MNKFTSYQQNLTESTQKLATPPKGKHQLSVSVNRQGLITGDYYVYATPSQFNDGTWQTRIRNAKLGTDYDSYSGGPHTKEGSGSKSEDAAIQYGMDLLARKVKGFYS